MGGKKTTKQTATQQQQQQQTQTVAPPSWTMPGIQAASDKVLAALGSLPTSTYQGPMTAVPDAGKTQALADQYRALGGQSAAMGDQLNAQLPGFTSTPLAYNSSLPTGTFQPQSAQDLNPAINAAIHPVFQQLTERILPGIRSSAIESGAYSGDRAMGIVPTQAINASNEAAQRLAATIGYEDYNNRENRRLEAWNGDQNRLLQGFGLDTQRQQGEAELMSQRMSMLPDLMDTVMRMRTANADLGQTALGLETGQQQAGISEALAREQYNLTRPFAGLDVASALLSQLSGNYGTTSNTGSSSGSSTSKTVEKTGGLGSVVQGLAGLAAGAMSMGGAGGLGALFGGGGGALSQSLGQAAANIPIPVLNPGAGLWPSANLFGR